MVDLSGVDVKITTPPPSVVDVGKVYTIEGTAKIGGALGAPPWIYLRVQKKEWYQPSALEDTEFIRGYTLPTDGKVSIDWTPAEPGKYNVALVATPAPMSLPFIGVPPIMGESETVNVTCEGALSQIIDLKITSYSLVRGG